MSEIRNVTSNSSTPFTGGIGTIDAGSTVAISAAVAEVIAMLQKMQENEAKAACMTADVQTAMAQTSAKATIQSANDQAEIAKTQAIGSFVSAGFSAVSLGATTLSAYKTTFNSESTELKNLNSSANKINPAEVEVQAGNAPARQLSAQDVADIKADIKNGKRLTDDQIDALKSLSEPELEGVKQTIADRQAELEKTIEANTKYWNRVENIAGVTKDLAASITNGVVGVNNSQLEADKGQQDALTKLADAMQNQTAQNYQTLLQQRSQLQDEIIQILGSKESAVKSLVQYQG